MKCKYCKSEIIWVKTRKGKAMPCDPQLVPFITGGKGRIVTPNGKVLACTICETEEEKEKADGAGYIPHWSTCAGGID